MKSKSGIDDAIKRINKVADLVNAKNGKKLDLTKEQIFTKGGPFLHEKSGDLSEEESANFERNNTELFNFLRQLDDNLRDLF